MGAHEIRQLYELERWSGDQPSLEEYPKKRVYIYYCDVCSSVLALHSRLDSRHSFLYRIVDECPICHLRLEESLRCRALYVRLPNNLLEVDTTQRNIALHKVMRNSLPNEELWQHNKPTAVLERTPQHDSSHLSFGDNFLDQLCGGVHVRQLTVLYGGKVCQAIAEQLCVRSQLPITAGGFNSSSVFIDGGNTFDAYHIANYATTLQLDRDEILRRIRISRAFTCYQLVNLIVEKLPELLSEERIRLVVIANLLDMFLDPDLNLKEAKQIVNFLSGFLVQFARENDLAIIASCRAKKDNRDTYLRQFLASRAQVVLKVERANRKLELVLEKHPAKQHTTLMLDDYGTPQLSRTQRTILLT